MENEAKKAIHLEDLDKVTGGLSPWAREMWDGKCPYCGSTNIEYDGAAHEEKCLNCNTLITNQDIMDRYHKPGEPFV